MPTRRPTDLPAAPARADAPRPVPRERRATPETRTTTQNDTRTTVAPEARRALIAQNAYLRAERRGFEPGHAEEDWLGAEAEVDALLRVEHGGSSQ